MGVRRALRQTTASLASHDRRVDSSSNEVMIRLSRDEALVLFDWLHRSEGHDGVSLLELDGERVALWNLSALLERELAEPFKPEYERLVAEARGRLASSRTDDA
jgi:hypothetical protein